MDHRLVFYLESSSKGNDAHTHSHKNIAANISSARPTGLAYLFRNGKHRWCVRVCLQLKQEFCSDLNESAIFDFLNEMCCNEVLFVRISY